MRLKPDAFRFTLGLMLIAVLSLTACQRLGLLYNRMDWYANWRVSRYVDLNEHQQQQFDREFHRLWRWHRQHALPTYIADLRALRPQLQKPVTAEQVQQWMQHAELRLSSVVAHALSPLCGFAQTLNEQQVATILARIDRDNAEFVEKYVAPSERRRRREVEKRQQRHLERWLGKMTREQQTLLHAWSRDRQELAPAYLSYREQWQAQLALGLAHRQREEGCRRLEALLLYPREQQPPELQRRSAAAQLHWASMVAAILNAMTDAQRQHLDRRITETIAQLGQLSRRFEHEPAGDQRNGGRA